MEAVVIRAYPIYRRPAEYRDSIVIREWFSDGDGVRMGGVVYQGPDHDLEAAREWCLERGLARMDRHPNDDPSIVEVWL
jgi:hypothetical protein